MDDAKKLESLKIEVRSILLPFQKGCYLTEFNRAYLELIGKRLPFREMGYTKEIDFLYSMPDVVRITPMARGTYHLMGIADDKSKHIQKMVAKQKPAKLKGPPPPRIRTVRSSRIGSLPPRFSRTHQTYDSSFSYEAYSKEPVTHPVTSPKEEPVWAIEEPKLPKEESKSSPKISPMDEVVALVDNLKRLAIDDVLCEYKRMYNKNLSLSTYGFSTIEECLNEIPELQIVQQNNVKFVTRLSENQNFSNSTPVEDTNSSKIPAPEESSFNIYKQNCDNNNVPTSLEEKLQKVAEKYSFGILASEFPCCFEQVTGHALDFSSLGYRCLMDLIDDVPGIFVRIPVAGSKKDYRIYPANSYISKEIVDNESPIQRITLNLRRILVAYPEGIKLTDLTTVYSINCKESLHVKEFGFEDLEKFLSSVESDVPLKFGSIDGVKSIHLVKFSETPAADPHNVDSRVYNQEAIPFDAEFPEFRYKPHTFPKDFDFSVFIPAYTSSVANAGHLYLQFQEDGCSDVLEKLGTEIDNFYNGGESELYTMKSIHIAVGASCIAKWPADDHWYRAQILSIPSMQNVRVLYVDYGTTDIIPKFLLRYAKKEFVEVPVQAVRCRLAFLRPPNNAPKWDIQTRNRILQLCQNVPLMAKIEEIGPDGIYSVLLCDTNGDDDVFINDLLIKEGLAENSTEPSGNLHSPQLLPEQSPYLHPLQALQAQYFLKAFAATAPIFAQNELYLSLLREVTAFCGNSDPVSHSANIPNIPSIVPPGFNTFPQGFNSLNNSVAFHNSYSNAAPAIGANSTKISKPNILPLKDFYSASIESPQSSVLTSPAVIPEENEDIEKPEHGHFLKHESDTSIDLFVDDPEIFQQFYSSIISRHIKRVMLGDGYKMHIIVLDSQPYASSGEISQLIWNNKEADYLITRLQLKEVDIPVRMVSEDGHEKLFQQLIKYNVKGVQKTNGFKSSIVLYTLKDVMKILNIFGHPSVTLRTRLTEEISNFNPNDPYWKVDDEHCDDSDPEDEDSLSAIVHSSATDDDKIEKLCLYDLLAMKESIVCKRKKMLSSTDLCKSTDEIDKLQKLLHKVLNRIKEIREICRVFS